jgi:hypothetical protein
MGWIIEQVDANNILSKVRSGSMDYSRNNTVTKISNRKRKVPNNRNEDFLCEM